MFLDEDLYDPEWFDHFGKKPDIKVTQIGDLIDEVVTDFNETYGGYVSAGGHVSSSIIITGEPLDPNARLKQFDGLEVPAFVQRKINSQKSLKQLYCELDEECKKYKEHTFSDFLFSILRQEEIDEVEFYKKAEIDRKLFSKIRSNRDYSPSKDTVIKVIFALKADLELAEELLRSAGYSFSSTIMRDVIIKYFVRHNIYNKRRLDEVLDHYGEKTLFSQK